MASINPFLPIQEGTGDPSPENIRPIKPAVSIVGGKNLLEISPDKKVVHIGSNMGTFTEIESGIQTSSEYNNLGGYLVLVKPNTTYTYSANFSISNSDVAMRIWEYETKISAITAAGKGLTVNIFNPGISRSAVFTTSNTTNYIVVGFYTGDSQAHGLTITNMMIEEGSTATSYEPYQTLDIYGGYLDIANSRIIEEWNKIKIADRKWNNYSAKKYYYTYVTQDSFLNRKLNTCIYSDTLTPRGDGQFLKAPVGYATYYGESTTVTSYYNYIWTTLPEAMEVVDANAWIAETYPNAEICYKLETPITYNLTPTQLAQAMEQLGIKLSSTLIDARRKILLNSPHLETTSGSIANFSTDMKAPLKECKIHFLPVQEGSGVPSPTNIRPITGWTGVNINQTGKNLLPVTGTPIQNVQKMYLPEGNTVTVSVLSNGSADPEFVVYDKNRVQFDYWRMRSIDQSTGRKYCKIINMPSFEYYRINSSSYDAQMEINVDSPTNFEEYYGNNFNIDFDDIYYGGYVDLVTGELIAEWEVASGLWGDIKSGSPNSTTGFYQGTLRLQNRIKTIHYKGEYGVLGLCNAIGTVMWEGSSMTPEHFYGGNDGSRGIFYIYCNYSDDQEIQIAAKLETPITYQLTPQQLKSLKGINNIWSDTNDAIEVKYWTH